MYITDLVSEFEITYDIGSLGLPGFKENEIKKLLELSQYRVISQRLQGNNVYQSKFPDTNKRIDDLQGLMVQASYSAGTGTLGLGLAYNSTYLITLPDDFLHIWEVRIHYNATGSELAKQIKLSDNIRFNNGKNNTDPYIKNPVYSFAQSSGGNRQLRLYPNSEITFENDTDVFCIYIKKPTNLETVGVTIPDDILIDFNDDVYHEIVAGAVDHAISIATPNKSQVSQQQLNKAE